MNHIESQQLIFNSVLDCLASGQERYKELFIYMLNKIECLNDIFTDDELFLILCQLSNSKIKIDVFQIFLGKLKDAKKILKIESQTTGNSILHIMLKNKVDVQIIDLFLNIIDGDLSILNKQNKHGDTPLHFVIKYSKQLKTLEALLKYPVSLSLTNKDKNTPLHLAVMLLTHNRDFDTFILEQQMLIFNRLIENAKENHFNSKNKYGNTVLHQLVADMDFYRGIVNSNEGYSFEDLLKNCQAKKSQFKRIYDFFQRNYPAAIFQIVSKIHKIGVNLKLRNHLNQTAFQMAFLKKHFSAIQILFSIGDSLSKEDLEQNQFSHIALSLVQNANQEKLECLKIFVLAGGGVSLKNTQLGHAVLKHSLMEALDIELTNLLISKAGARILDNGDAHEIWKSLFFKLNHSNDNHYKVNTLKMLFHIGLDYLSNDNYGRDAQDLAKMYNLQDEFVQARQQFEVYSLTGNKIPQVLEKAQFFNYH